MNNKIFLILLMLFPLFSIGQSNYKNGYLINLKGDTVRGYINYKEWGHNPENISFKSTLDGKLQKFAANDITYFEIIGAARYKRYQVNISLTSVDISSAASLHDTSSKNDLVFLKILQKGKYLTLYAYADAIKPRFYTSEANDSAPLELTYGVYETPGGGSGVLFVNAYQDQLTALAVKYVPKPDNIINDLKYAKYTEPDLVSIVARINGDAIIKEASFSGKYPRYRLFAGAAIERSTIKTAENQQTAVSPSTSYGPKITAGIDVFANPSVGHLIFRLELAYDIHSGYEFNGGENLQTLSQNTFSVTPQVTYNLYNASELKVFINAGYNLNFSSYGNTGSSTVPLLAKWGGPQLKAGIVVAKKVEIYGSYYPSTSLTDFMAFAVPISSYQIGLNYFFK